MHCQRSFKAASSVVVLSLLGGCAFAGRSHDVESLNPSASPYEADIPVPTEFRLVDRSSEDWSSGPIRYLRHRYHGRADKNIVRKFYREQMPLVRWTPVSDHNVQGRIMMRFQRGAESCTVMIEDQAEGFTLRGIRRGSRPATHRPLAVDVVIAPQRP